MARDTEGSGKKDSEPRKEEGHFLEKKETEQMKTETDKQGEIVAEAPEAEEQQVEQAPEASEEEADSANPMTIPVTVRDSHGNELLSDELLLDLELDELFEELLLD